MTPFVLLNFMKTNQHLFLLFSSGSKALELPSSSESVSEFRDQIDVPGCPALRQTSNQPQHLSFTKPLRKLSKGKNIYLKHSFMCKRQMH